MPTIVFANPKGGAGKSTGVLILATQLAHDTKVCVVDADVRKRIAKWARGGSCPANMEVISDANEDDVIDRIDEARSKAPIVIVDLEGTASKLVLLAISQADLVVIPLQDSALDADEAGAVIKVIRQQERLSGRKVPFVIVPTRTQAAYRSKLMAYILEQLRPSGAMVLPVEIVERSAYKAMFVYDAPLELLPAGEVAGVGKAIENARAYTQAIIQVLKEVSK